MRGAEIRQKWVKFFQDKGHLHLPSASLIPDNPTLLLNAAGMVPFVPYFLGQATPPNNRVVTVQKCVRVGGKDSDLENIGKTPRHLTFFEMLGNFSFGDYFKKEVISWAWELLIDVYKFNPDDLSVSIFEGDQKVGEDTEAFDYWRAIGVPESKIIRMGKEDNFWGPPGGISGPCGPCTEIYYHPKDGSEPIEVWNLVFMQYEQLEGGEMKPLTKPNVDTGLGMERLACILQGKDSVFETDLLKPIVDKVNALSGQANSMASKIIADHIRCASMLIADGIKPGNLGREYILRMLIRRAARYGRLIGLEDPFAASLYPAVHNILGEAYPEVNSNSIADTLTAEEELFQKTVSKGLKRFNDLVEGKNSLEGEAAFDLYATYGFPLELTLDLAEERDIKIDLDEYEAAKKKHSEASNKGKFDHGFKSAGYNFVTEDKKTYINAGEDKIEISDIEFLGYEFESSHSQILFSTTDSLILDKTPFYAESGGQLADKGIISSDCGKVQFKVSNVKKQANTFIHSGEYITDTAFNNGQSVMAQIDSGRRKEIRKHHTATHLLQAALRQVVGDSTQQAGSQVDDNRLRFDFTAAKGLSPEQLEKVESLVSQWINNNYEVKTNSMSFDKAIESGALAFFDDKYEDEVRVLSIGGEQPVSVELCGGTHVSNTAQIEHAQIISESSIANGVRRIEMIVGNALTVSLREKAAITDSLSKSLKVPVEKIEGKVTELEKQIKDQQKQIKDFEKNLASLTTESLLSQVKDSNGLNILISETSVKNIRMLLDGIANKLNGKDYLLVLLNVSGEKIAYACKTNSSNHSAKEIIQSIAKATGGSGGGKDQMAQGGAPMNEDINVSGILDSIRNTL